MLIKYNDKLTMPKYEGQVACIIAVKDPKYFMWLKINTKHTFDVSLTNSIVSNFCGVKIKEDCFVTLWEAPKAGTSYRGDYPCKVKVVDWVIKENIITLKSNNHYYYNISENELAPKVRAIQVGDYVTVKHDTSISSSLYKHKGQSFKIIKILADGYYKLANFSDAYCFSPTKFVEQKHTVSGIEKVVNLSFDVNNPPFKAGDSFTYKDSAKRCITTVKQNSFGLVLGYYTLSGMYEKSHYRSDNYTKFKFFTNGESQKQPDNEIHRSAVNDGKGPDERRSLFPCFDKENRVQGIAFPSKSRFGKNKSIFV